MITNEEIVKLAWKCWNTSSTFDQYVERFYRAAYAKGLEDGAERFKHDGEMNLVDRIYVAKYLRTLAEEARKS